MMIRVGFLTTNAVQPPPPPPEPDDPVRQQQQKAHNSDAVQELLAGASTSMFVNSYGVALSAIEGGKTYVTVWVAVIAALILALSTVRFWLLRRTWGEANDWQATAFLALALALLAAEIAAIVEVTAFYAAAPAA